MRLVEFFVILESLDGTFVGAKLTPETEDKLVDWMSNLGIQNPEPREDIHITVIGDKEKEFPWKAKKYPPLKIDPSTLFIEEFPEGDDGKPLVLRLDSPALQKRHKWGRETYDIDWKFPEYKPHITLGYDTGVSPDEIDPPDFPLFIEGEYTSPWISD